MTSCRCVDIKMCRRFSFNRVRNVIMLILTCFSKTTHQSSRCVVWMSPYLLTWPTSCPRCVCYCCSPLGMSSCLLSALIKFLSMFIAVTDKTSVRWPCELSHYHWILTYLLTYLLTWRPFTVWIESISLSLWG